MLYIFYLIDLTIQQQWQQFQKTKGNNNNDLTNLLTKQASNMANMTTFWLIILANNTNGHLENYIKANKISMKWFHGNVLYCSVGYLKFVIDHSSNIILAVCLHKYMQ